MYLFYGNGIRTKTLLKNQYMSSAWWDIPEMVVLRMLRQEADDQPGLYGKFQAGWAHNKKSNGRSMSNQNRTKHSSACGPRFIRLFPPAIFSGVHLGGPCLLDW